MNRRAFFAAVGSSAALPAVGEDPQVLAALRRDAFTQARLAELQKQLEAFGRNLSVMTWGTS